MSENVDDSPVPPCGENQNDVLQMPPSPSPLSNGIGAGPSQPNLNHNVAASSEPSYNYNFIGGRVPTFDYNDPIALNLIKEQVR